MTAVPRPRPATIEDFLARPAHERIELIRGTIVEKASPSGEHSFAQVELPAILRERFRKPKDGGSGGWWFLTEMDLQLAGEIFRPDVAGHRHARSPAPPKGRPVTLVPDWICEILSPSNESRDRVEKMDSYFQAGLPHYWIMNLKEGTLEVFRRTDLAFSRILAARRGQLVRAEPFEEVEFSVDELLGDVSALG